MPAATPDNPNDAPAIRAIVVQPSLAAYRAAVYRELASRDEIDLRLWYGTDPGITNVEPDGFRAEHRPQRVWKLAGQEFFWQQAQVDAARRDDVDVIVLGWASRYLSLGPALRAAKRRGVGIVLWGHGFSRSESPLRKWNRDRIASKADALLFYDQKTADAAIDAGQAADRVYVAHNAIDQKPIAAATDEWRSDPGRLDAFRTTEGLQGRRVLLYVSRFTPKNRLPLLVDAVERLRQTHPDVLAVMIGGGELFDPIQEDIRRRGLAENFRLLGPIYEESRLAPWFLSAEAFVYPSAIGLSILHAFGYGLPVITDDAWSNHNPEIVAYQPDASLPDANGLAYRHGDGGSLAATLARLLDDPPLRERLAEGALRTVRQRYNVSAMVDGMAAAIRHAARR